ncbi:LeuA1 [Desulfamplus magnetovallimortis]|uniref:2-isopropylmalate synthase n=1 Tax=Desulfamplus magnetovallimortis TaxID=1246637 RepID=A0A1W1HH64_9BACT|nr:hypothetical protein [Desulfamplus magnetovallimortis]SLM31786.1 LeuA1 [Desulfamplus magnetovallimortis]
MKKQQIVVIDETIREGMQYRGVVFSLAQREKILKFQEQLGVDICQAGYAPAHITEERCISNLGALTRKERLAINVAAMGRASEKDIISLVETGVQNFHLHSHISHDIKNNNDNCQAIFDSMGRVVNAIREVVDGAVISMAVLDVGNATLKLLGQVSIFLAGEVGVDIISLPDTSGIMAPDSFYDRIKSVTDKVNKLKCNTKVSVHCHNDLGMASANTFMGVKAGATVVELSAMGIGERNGIADLFTVGRLLKDKGYELNLDVNNIETFRDYYQFVSDICKEQTGEHLLGYNTPFFGDAANTHVAGTHAGTGFGLMRDEAYFLNVLCGQRLVKNYLDSMDISYNSSRIKSITEAIKSKSATLSRALNHNEVRAIVSDS